MLVGRSGLSPVMVGRAAELDRLVGLIDARPDPSVALVAGEAGIGKTRLVQELVAHAPATALVLAGQADPGAESRPMELFRDALGCRNALYLDGSISALSAPDGLSVGWGIRVGPILAAFDRAGPVS